jgi:hypothetical protein
VNHIFTQSHSIDNVIEQITKCTDHIEMSSSHDCLLGLHPHQSPTCTSVNHASISCPWHLYKPHASLEGEALSMDLPHSGLCAPCISSHLLDR